MVEFVQSVALFLAGSATIVGYVLRRFARSIASVANECLTRPWRRGVGDGEQAGVARTCAVAQGRTPPPSVTLPCRATWRPQVRAYGAIPAQKRAAGYSSNVARGRHSVPAHAQVQSTPHGLHSKMELLGLWQEHVRRKRELLFPESSFVAQIGFQRTAARNDL